MLNSNDKGAIAEQAIVWCATKLGVPVLKPVSEHGRVDLALDIAGRIWRVQCKWGRLAPSGDVIIVHTGNCRLSTAGYVRNTYSQDEVDLFAVYCGDLDRAFLIPATLVAGKHGIQLRLRPPKVSASMH